MRKPEIWRALLVALLIAMLVLPVAAQDDESAVQDEYTIRPETLLVTVSATGVVEPSRSVELNFQSTGAPVDEVLIQEGDTVREGDLIAILDAEDLQAALREAEIALELQELALEALTAEARDVDVAVAEAAVAAAEASRDSAGFGPTPEQVEIARVQAELARNQLWQSQLQRDKLFDLNPEFRGGRPNEIQSQSGVEQAEFGVIIADAGIDATIRSGGGLSAIASAEASLVRAQVQLDQLLRGPDEVELLRFEIQLDQARLAVEQAQVALERTQLEAPFSGVVSQNNLTVGELPPANQPAIEIIDNNSYFIDLAIDENDIVNVGLGQVVTLRLDALPEAEVTGTITRLSVLPDPTNAVVVYRARVTLDPTEAPIRVGMSTTATITTRELNDVLTLPNRFIRIDRDTEQAFATIQTGDNQFEDILIVLGERNNERSQVLSGLEPGQVVVQVRRDAPGVEVIFGG